MNKSKGSSTKNVPSRRQAVREKRLQQQRTRRLYIIIGVAVVAVVIAAIMIIPSLLPAGPIVKITPTPEPMADGRALGDPNAPVKVEVFSDFQCPACQRYSQQVEQPIVDKYVPTKQIYYIYRQFPFIDDNSTSKESDQAANASMCAAEQNRFWDYKQILFANWNGENQGAFADKRLISFAEALNLDMTKFNKCFGENTYKAEIDSDLQLGNTLGASGTPSIFVNGVQVAPGYIPTYDDLSKAIEDALAGSGR